MLVIIRSYPYEAPLIHYMTLQNQINNSFMYENNKTLIELIRKKHVEWSSMTNFFEGPKLLFGYYAKLKKNHLTNTSMAWSGNLNLSRTFDMI